MSLQALFLTEGLFSQMLRADNHDKQSKTELGSKAGDVSKWLFLYKYYNYLWKTYPFANESADQQRLLERVKNMLGSPNDWVINFGFQSCVNADLCPTGE